MNAEAHYLDLPWQQDVQRLHSKQLKLGDSGEAVEQLQRLLQGRAFYVGPIDGHYGTATERAVLRLQRQLNLMETGQFDQPTYAALQSDSDSLIW
jgi:peptidoglycan hydrolase-like protein with peptidoglycan-binding domain